MHAHASSNGTGRPAGAPAPARQQRRARSSKAANKRTLVSDGNSRTAVGKLSAVSAPAREVGDSAGLDSRTGCTISFSVTGDVRFHFSLLLTCQVSMFGSWQQAHLLHDTEEVAFTCSLPLLHNTHRHLPV